MQKRTLLILLSLIFTVVAFSQNEVYTTSAHAPSIFIEGAGNAGLASINYDMRFSQKRTGLGARIGVGVAYKMSGHVFFVTTTTFPIAINYLLGSGRNYLEAGAGVTIGTDRFPFDGDKRYFVPNLGYRFQSLKRGFMFRTVLSPLIGSKVKFGAGLSLGVVF